MDIDNLTIKEVKDICNSQEDCLPTCPFYVEPFDFRSLECIFYTEPPCLWPDRTKEDCE